MALLRPPAAHGAAARRRHPVGGQAPAGRQRHAGRPHPSQERPAAPGGRGGPSTRPRGRRCHDPDRRSGAARYVRRGQPSTHSPRSDLVFRPTSFPRAHRPRSGRRSERPTHHEADRTAGSRTWTSGSRRRADPSQNRPIAPRRETPQAGPHPSDHRHRHDPNPRRRAARPLPHDVQRAGDPLRGHRSQPILHAAHESRRLQDAPDRRRRPWLPHRRRAHDGGPAHRPHQRPADEDRRNPQDPWCPNPRATDRPPRCRPAGHRHLGGHQRHDPSGLHLRPTPRNGRRTHAHRSTALAPPAPTNDGGTRPCEQGRSEQGQRRVHGPDRAPGKPTEAHSAPSRAHSRPKREEGPRRAPQLSEIGRRPTLPGPLDPSTIGAGGLNFRVRNGNGCDPAAMATQICCSRDEAAGTAPDEPLENSTANTSIHYINQALGRLVPVS